MIGEIRTTTDGVVGFPSIGQRLELLQVPLVRLLVSPSDGLDGLLPWLGGPHRKTRRLGSARQHIVLQRHFAGVADPRALVFLEHARRARRRTRDGRVLP